MARYIQEGKIINYQNGTDGKISYGDVVVLSGRIGVASVDIPTGSIGTVQLEGVFEISAETSAAFTVGETVYWDGANKRVTAAKPTSDAVVAGIVVEPKASSAAAAFIKL